MSEHQPSSGDFNREDNDDTSCVMCGRDLNKGTRFCSKDCYDEAQRDGYTPPKPMTLEEMQAEMKGVFARLRKYDEEENS